MQAAAGDLVDLVIDRGERALRFCLGEEVKVRWHADVLFNVEAGERAAAPNVELLRLGQG